MLPFPFLFASLRGADPAARLDAFLKAHPAFVATVEVSAGGPTFATGTLRAVRPGRLRFDLKGKGIDYSLFSTPETYMELDRLERVYDEHPPIGGEIVESRLSSAAGYLPGFLLRGAAVFGGAKPKAVAVAGGDELRATVKTQMGDVELRLLVDPQGKPLRFSQSGAGSARTWRLKTFADSKDLAPYRIEAPLGYVPFALPQLAAPLAVGQAAPLTGWRRGGKPLDLGAQERGKPRLLAVLGADCPPSRAVRPALASLAKTMPVFVLGAGEVTDPSGTLMRRLSPPGTPMFYLVGGDGKVKALWLGFDPAKATAWEAEVRAEAAG